MIKRITKSCLLIILVLLNGINVYAQNLSYQHNWTYTGSSINKSGDGTYELDTPLAEFTTDEQIMVLSKISELKDYGSLQLKHELLRDDDIIKSQVAAITLNGDKLFAQNNFGQLTVGNYQIKAIFINDNEESVIDTVNIRVIEVGQVSTEGINDEYYSDVNQRYENYEEGYTEQYMIDPVIYDDPDIYIEPRVHRPWLYSGFYPAAFGAFYSRRYWSGGRFIGPRPGRPGRPNRPERPNRPDRPSRPDRPNRPQRPGDGINRPDRPSNLPNRPDLDRPGQRPGSGLDGRFQQPNRSRPNQNIRQRPSGGNIQRSPNRVPSGGGFRGGGGSRGGGSRGGGSRGGGRRR